LVQDFLRSDAAFFQSLTKYVLENATEVDAQLKPFLDRDAEHLDQIERAVLRMATAELLIHPETPFKVVVNEAVNLTKKFGADKAYKFVNGVLDKVAGAVRKDRK